MAPPTTDVLHSGEDEAFGPYVMRTVSFQAPVRRDESGRAVGEEMLWVSARIARENIAEALARPYLLYLQGGPGFASPTHMPVWAREAARDYQVVLLDQRGTGDSSPVTTEALAGWREAGWSDDRICEYLAHFRADAIVEDAELLRGLLGARSWTLLGQSFGGFCTLTYLSRHPESLAGAMVCGGLPSVRAHADAARDVYRLCLAEVATKTRAYYAAYPQDVARVRAILAELRRQPLALPRGGVLTARRFRAVGLNLGFMSGSWSTHALVRAALAPEGEPGSPAVRERVRVHDNYAFACAAEEALHFDSNPLYMLLHEPIYWQAAHGGGWAAQRVVAAGAEDGVWAQAGVARDPALADDAAALDAPLAVTVRVPARFAGDGDGAGVGVDAAGAARADGCVEVYAPLLTGEMVFPWMCDDFERLRPWRGVADALAARSHWPALYDPQALASADVPVCAIVYEQDMYVPHSLSMETARLLRRAWVWQHPTYEHSALGDHGAEVFGTLHRNLCSLQEARRVERRRQDLQPRRALATLAASAVAVAAALHISKAVLSRR